MNKFPQISIVIVTLNNQETIGRCAESIIKQDYPVDLIEKINIDGGSEDSTTKILSSYGFMVIRSEIRGAEAQRAIGVRKAKHNLIVSIDADNCLPTRDWLKRMVEPFRKEIDIIYSGTLHFTYRKKDSLINRYYTLFGAYDPVVYYLGRPDRLPFYKNDWNRSEVVEETKNYFIVEFDKETLPTVGCNGVVYRRDLLLSYAKSNPEDFYHIDVFVDLIEKGYTKYAIVKNDVIHDTALTFRSLMCKRVAFLKNYYLKEYGRRRYFIYSPRKIKDNLKLLLYILASLTVIKPLVDSIRGYSKIKDRAWFLHPLVCLMYLYTYSLATVQNLIGRKE